jgi:hypothetical protein
MFFITKEKEENEMSYSSIIEENNLVLVDSWSGQESYEWTEIEVYYSEEKRQYFWLSGSGCSCNSLWDDVNSIEDLCNGSRKNAIDAIKRFAEENKRWKGISSSKMVSE